MRGEGGKGEGERMMVGGVDGRGRGRGWRVEGEGEEGRVRGKGGG